MSYQLAAELFAFPLALVDLEGRLVFANSVWREFFQDESGAIVYQNWTFSSRLPPAICWKHATTDMAQTKQKTFRIETREKSYDVSISEGRKEADSLIWIRFENSGQSLSDSESIANDERLSAMAEMAAGIAHEILNPLTIIAGKTSILQSFLPRTEDKKSLDAHKCMDSITNQCNRITKIVRALRTFSRNGSQDALQPVSLKQIVDESIALCSEKSRLKGTRFHVEELSDPKLVYCRAVQAVQILINLISNAIDATQDVDLPEVQIRFRQTPDAIDILVSDNGPGVPEHLAQKIFQPFYTTKDVGKGTGLGLSLSLRLSRDNGGDLFLDRNLGPSCFGLQLKTSNPMKAAA